MNAANYYPEKPLNWFERVILRARMRERRGFKTTWGELYYKWGFSVQYSCYEQPCFHFIFLCISVWINLKRPWKWCSGTGDGAFDHTTGISWFEGAFHLSWKGNTKLYHMPWNYDFYRSTVWNSEGKEIVRYYFDRTPDYSSELAHKEVYPFKYVNRDGTIDDVQATVYGHEYEWRRFRFFPWPRKVRRSINVSFSAEVGPGKGSWKGGVVGTGWRWNRDETLYDALMNMQHNWKA